MEQQFQLKEYGDYDLFEQAVMTAEDRAWTVKRIEREMKARQDAEKKQAANMPRPRVPSGRRR